MPASCGTQTVASTVQDLALPSLPSQNNCSGSSLQMPPTPAAFLGCDLSTAWAARGLLYEPAAAAHRHTGARHLLALRRGRSCSPRQEGCPGCGPGQKSCLLGAGPRSKAWRCLSPRSPYTPDSRIPNGGCPWLYLFCFPVPKPALDWSTSGQGTCSLLRNPAAFVLGRPPHQPGDLYLD